VHSADIQDRDGGVLVMATLFGLHPFLLKLYADGGYQGPIFQSALRKILRQIDVEIVKRSDIAKGFAVLPKRWIVERTIAWLTRRRLKRGVFRSVVDLQVAINRFVAETNADPKPFVWTADPKRVLAAVKRGKQALESIH